MAAPSATLSHQERCSHLTNKMPARTGVTAGTASKSQEPDSSGQFLGCDPFPLFSLTDTGTRQVSYDPRGGKSTITRMDTAPPRVCARSVLFPRPHATPPASSVSRLPDAHPRGPTLVPGASRTRGASSTLCRLLTPVVTKGRCQLKPR